MTAEELAARYSALDRCLHRAAFSTLWLQRGLAEVEDRIFRRRLDRSAVVRPVFIAGLPRAGTTLLLEILAATPVFAAHTYRSMPFVLTPLLWDAYSRPFRASSAAADATVERAHGDGMTIGYDSPEAFEEVVWRAFWPKKYRDDRIVPWTADDQDDRGEFDAFFRSHVAKVVALRQADGPPRRYLSKNNANIARLPKLRRLFSDAVLVVPFRDPAAQALSMHRQHVNFCELHAASPFARRYMADLGHFEFGANLRPIDFGAGTGATTLPPRIDSDATKLPPGADSDATELPPGAHAAHAARNPNFWLRYWCSAYRHLLELASGDDLALWSHDALCADPAGRLARLGAIVGMDDPSAVAASAERVREPAPAHFEARSAFDGRLLAEADGVHEALLERCTEG